VSKPFTQILPGFSYKVTPLQALLISVLYGHSLADEIARRDGFSLSADWPRQLLPGRGDIPTPRALGEDGDVLADPDLCAL